MFIACEDPDPIDPITPEEPTPDDPVSEDTVETYSILGHWIMEKATQNSNGNEIDMSNFYVNFQLIFEEDGTLITTDDINQSEMAWTLEGDQLGFIQVPGAEPVMYTIKKLTADELDIENGTGSNVVTLMEFKRM